MNKIFKLITSISFLFFSINAALSEENFFNEALKMYQNEKYEDARFMLERNIVFNPKDAKSYLYLAKIYNHEEDQNKEEYNLETTLLIEPNNEEAILMLMKIALKKSNYSKVNDLSQTFIKVCKKLCDENNEIQKSLKNIEPATMSLDQNLNKILIIDFGSQFTQLIARRIRELGVFSEIVSHKKIKIKHIDKSIKGIILSGGPLNVYEINKYSFDKKIINLSIPILGICFGHQILSKLNGGRVKQSKHREFGLANIYKKNESLLIKNFFNKQKSKKVWMSHADQVSKLPKNFKVIASSTNSKFAIVENKLNKFYGIQFHPEVTHTENGKKLISNFIFLICKIKRNWSSKDQKIQLIKEVKDQVGSEKVICALSGGVDSSVVAQLLNKAIGKKLYCIFVNTGLLRKNEEVQVVQTFKKRLKINLIYVNAEKEFLKKLHNVSDPEKKRKIIGNLFIKIFERYAKKIKNVKFLAQGTLYPDLIESRSVTGSQTSKIKSHHNVGGLPKKMKLKLVEPLKFLFKDEVRKLGLELNLNKDIISRHPFPGPGLAIRMPGLITNEKIKILKEADYYFIQALRDHGLYHKIWQAYAALLPVKTVGVMGDNRTYEYLCLLRAITSEDGMTADFYEFKKSFMETISNKIVNSIRGINRVVYDITSKPPSTIELE